MSDRLDPLPAEQLIAVSALWSKTKREVEAAFQGTSMLPTIAPGQTVTLIFDADIHEGDVVLAIQDGTPIVHRALLVTDRWILFRGDANLIPDMPVTDRSLVLGRLANIAPHRDTVLQRLVLRSFSLFLRVWFAGARRTIQLLIRLRRRSASLLMMAGRATHA